MINENTYDRLIGDFLEINGDITSDQFNSKYPKFIAKIIARRQRKKLLKALYKLRDSDYVLNYNNIKEFLLYVYNNFPPEGKYKSVSRVMYNEEKDILEAIIKFDDYSVIINTDESDEDLFNISIKKHLSTSDELGINVKTKELIPTIKDHEEAYKDINTRLRNDICNYIEYVIKLYLEGKR